MAAYCSVVGLGVALVATPMPASSAGALTTPNQPILPAGLPISVLALSGASIFGRRDSKSKEKPVDNYPNMVQALNDANREIATLSANLQQFKTIQMVSLQRYQTLFQELPLPCFTVNEIGNIVEWNRAAAAFFGINDEDVTDKPVAEILGQEVYRGHAQDAVYRVFLGYQPDPVILELKTGHGKTMKVKWFASPVKNSAGKVVGAVNTLGVMPAATQVDPYQSFIEQYNKAA